MRNLFEQKFDGEDRLWFHHALKSDGVLKGDFVTREDAEAARKRRSGGGGDVSIIDRHIMPAGEDNIVYAHHVRSGGSKITGPHQHRGSTMRNVSRR